MPLDQFLAVYCPGAQEPFHIPELPLADGEQPAGVIYRGSVRNVAILADTCCDGFTLGYKLPDWTTFCAVPHISNPLFFDGA